MNARLSPERLAEISARVAHAQEVAERADWILPHYQAVRASLTDVPALLAEVDRLRAQIDEMVHAAMGARKMRLFDEVGEVQNARTIADAQLARANTLDRLCRENRKRADQLVEQLAARTFYLADVEGLEGAPTLHTTVDAAKQWITDEGAEDRPWDWFQQDGVWEQWITSEDDDQPMHRGSGAVLPLTVLGDGIVAEAQLLRQHWLEKASRVALLTEVRDSQRDEIRRLQTEQGEVMQALGCGQHDEWDEVVHRARQSASGSAVSS